MKSTTAAVFSALAVAIAVGAIFALGQHVSEKDARLFAEDDQRRVTMIARSCGKAGALVQAPDTKKYSCIWRNRDGAVLIADLPDSPYVEYLAQR